MSQYGSIITAGCDADTTDGMNEAGLVANLLYLAEADYGADDGSRPLLSISAWTQYVLDCFATDAALEEGSPVRRLTLDGGQVYAGDAASRFQPAEPFAFLPAQEARRPMQSRRSSATSPAVAGPESPR